MRVVVPNFAAAGIHICQELLRVASVEVSQRGRQNNDVSEREVASQNQASHAMS